MELNDEIFTQKINLIILVRKLRKHPEEFDKAKNRRNWYEMVKADMPLRIGDDVILEDYCPEGYYCEAPLPFYTGRMLFREIRKMIKCFKNGMEDDYVVL